MNLIGVILGVLGFVGMFFSAFTGAAALLGVATHTMYVGLALISFSRALDSRAIVKEMSDEGINPPVASRIGQVMWSIVGLLVLAQSLSELFGFPLIKF